VHNERSILWDNHALLTNLGSYGFIKHLPAYEQDQRKKANPKPRQPSLPAVRQAGIGQGRTFFNRKRVQFLRAHRHSINKIYFIPSSFI